MGQQEKRSNSHTIGPQHQFQLHQLFEPNTWLMDLVNFGGLYYVFFVEANTRYLIAIEGNGIPITSEAYEQTSARVPTTNFMNVFKKFEEMNVYSTTPRGMILRSFQQERKPIKKVIGDSERAFWSSSMRNYFSSKNIAFERVNVSKEGHTRLAILDRLVRTIRDMLDNLGISGPILPKDMLKVVTIYNNTKHRTLGFTPKQAHNDKQIEEMILKRLRGDNYVTRGRANFELKIGDPVLVRRIYKPFEKKRGSTINEMFTITKINDDGTYDVSSGTSSREKVPRRDLRLMN